MKTMSSVEVKNRFGFFLDTAQKEPVVVTQNKRPVGIMLSMEDARNTLVAEMLLEKEEGYDEWFAAKVETTLNGLKDGDIKQVEHEEVMEEAIQLLK